MLLDIPLYEFFGMEDRHSGLSEHEQRLLDFYRSLDDNGKEDLETFAEAMSGNAHKRKLRMALERMNSVKDLGRAAAAGDGADWEDHPESEACVLYNSHAVSEADEIITVCGQSMEPQFHHGDRVLVQYCSELNYGDIGIFYVTGMGGVIKQVAHDRLHSLNPDYDDIFPYEDGAKVIGRVLGKITADMVPDTADRALYVVTKQIVLDVGYDRESLEGDRGKKYNGPVVLDPYGRKIPKPAHGTWNIARYTSSTHAIMDAVLDVYDHVVHKDMLIRRVYITACDLIPETEIPEDKPEQLDMFTNYETMKQEEEARQLAEEKERRLQRVTLAIQDKFGKNAMLKGMNLLEGGTTIERNGQIGGHKAGDE